MESQRFGKAARVVVAGTGQFGDRCVERISCRRRRFLPRNSGNRRVGSVTHRQCLGGVLRFHWQRQEVQHRLPDIHGVDRVGRQRGVDVPTRDLEGRRGVPQGLAQRSQRRLELLAARGVGRRRVRSSALVQLLELLGRVGDRMSDEVLLLRPMADAHDEGSGQRAEQQGEGEQPPARPLVCRQRQRRRANDDEDHELQPQPGLEWLEEADHQAGDSNRADDDGCHCAKVVPVGADALPPHEDATDEYPGRQPHRDGGAPTPGRGEPQPEAEPGSAQCGEQHHQQAATGPFARPHGGRR